MNKLSLFPLAAACAAPLPAQSIPVFVPALDDVPVALDPVTSLVQFEGSGHGYQCLLAIGSSHATRVDAPYLFARTRGLSSAAGATAAGTDGTRIWVSTSAGLRLVTDANTESAIETTVDGALSQQARILAGRCDDDLIDDLLCLSSNDVTVTVRYGTGAKATRVSTSPVLDLAWFDWDNDGKHDVAVFSADGCRVYSDDLVTQMVYFPIPASNAFIGESSNATGRSLVAIIEGTQAPYNGTNIVTIDVGTLAFGMTQIGTQSVDSVAFGDLDSDGTTDLAVAFTATSNPQILLNSSNVFVPTPYFRYESGFATELDVSGIRSHNTPLVIMDVDSDGDGDLVGVSESGLLTMESTTAGQLVAPTLTSASYGYSAPGVNYDLRITFNVTNPNPGRHLELLVGSMDGGGYSSVGQLEIEGSTPLSPGQLSFKIDETLLLEEARYCVIRDVSPAGEPGPAIRAVIARNASSGGPSNSWLTLNAHTSGSGTAVPSEDPNTGGHIIEIIPVTDPPPVDPNAGGGGSGGGG